MLSVQSRHDLLSNLGVSQWYGKYSLPNTILTPTELFAAEKVSPYVEISANSEPLVAVPIAEPLVLGEVIQQLEVDKGGKVEPDLSIDTSQKVLKVGAAVSLSLSIARFDDLLIFYESDGDGLADMGSEKTLLLSVAKFLCPLAGGSIELQSSSSFVWPPFFAESLLLDQSAYFEVSLKRWFGLQGFNDAKRVLYFGSSYSQIENILLELRAEYESEFIVLPFDATLSELLAVPVKKKGLWVILSQVGMSIV